PSFKGVKAQEEGERVAASDVVLTLRRAERRVVRAAPSSGFEPIWNAVTEELRRRDISKRQRSSGHLYAVSVAAAIGAGIAATETTFAALENWLTENCELRDGGWHLTKDLPGVS